MRYGLISAIVFLLCGCTAQWHLKQAIKKDPSLAQEKIKVVIDTLIITDSVFQIDTFVAHEIDTMIVDAQKGHVIIYKYKNRFIIKTQIKGDTIRLTKEIRVPQIKYVEKSKNNCLSILYIMSLFVLIILWALKKLYNR